MRPPTRWLPHAAGTAGRVRLGTGATACIYLLPPLLRELRQRFPALEIVVSTGNTPDMLRAIEENRIDLGAGDAAGGRPHARCAAGARRRVRADRAARHAAAARDHRGRAREAAAGAVRARREHAPRASTNGRCAPVIPLKSVMELGSVEAMKELVGAGLGCSVLPRMALRARERAPVRRALAQAAGSIASSRWCCAATSR